MVNYVDVFRVRLVESLLGEGMAFGSIPAAHMLSLLVAHCLGCVAPKIARIALLRH
jgi:hypothetical protein